MEIWKTTAISSDYEVSNLGRVRRATESQPRRSGFRHPAGTIRKPWRKAGSKYMLVTLRINGVNKGCLVHRLVMAAFVGHSALQVNHKNGKKDDNRLENLEYVDGARNRAHAKNVLDAYPKGSKHPNSKLTEDDVREILKMIAAGLTNREIAPVFGCTETNIYYIRKGLAWAHLGR
jgi:hypothetical protein